MSFEIKLKADDLTIFDTVKKFYEALDVKTADDHYYRYIETVGKLKGLNFSRDKLIDAVLRETFFAGIWYAHSFPEMVEKNEYELTNDDNVEPVNVNDLVDDDTMFG